MPGRNSKTKQKKAVKTKKSVKTQSAGKATPKPVRKEATLKQKGKKLSVKTATKKKVSIIAKAEKQAPARTSGGKTAAATKVAAKSKPKKNLSVRDKLILEIRKSLVAQRNELLTEAEEALNILPGQTIFPDMGDQASAEIDRSFMLRLRGREQRLLKKIEQAMDKIDTGSFGICEVCGEEIDVKRLHARPVTTMCIFCKTEQEEEEKLRGA